MPTQTTDIFTNSGSAALIFQIGQAQWTVANGVKVHYLSGGGFGYGVLNVQNGSLLVNRGSVLSEVSFGALFGANGAEDMTIENKAGGKIVGTTGVSIGGTGSKDMTVKNDGTIEGTSQTGVFADDVSKFKLINTGEILGAFTAVSLTWEAGGPGGGAKVVNKGLIHSPLYGDFGRRRRPRSNHHDRQPEERGDRGRPYGNRCPHRGVLRHRCGRG